MEKQPTENQATERQIRRKTIVAFSVFATCIGLGILGWKWMINQPEKDGIPKPLRSALKANEAIFEKTVSDKHLAKTYPESRAAKKVRVNGKIGMKDQIDLQEWRMRVVLSDSQTLLLTLEDLQKLPKTEITFDFKCIEGWSQVTNWGGVKFSDFAAHFHLEKAVSLAYVGLQTPDKKYYVGIDMPSAMHPQTLLCYEMNGKPLPDEQGAPLRLIIPTKYGIKSIKRIGQMFFSNEPPPDYWAERGYDYFSGL